MDQDLASRQEARELGKQAEEAQKVLRTFSQEKLDAIVQAVSQAFLSSAGELGRMAWEETGFGTPQDKEIKNRFAAQPGLGGHPGPADRGHSPGGPGAKGLGCGSPRRGHCRHCSLHQSHLNRVL